MSQIGVKAVNTRQESATIFQQALAEIAPVISEETGLTELYQGAMEFERNSIDFYRTQAQQADDEHAREFYEFLVEQERGHLNLLATTLQYLDDPESWYFTEEQWIVEG